MRTLLPKFVHPSIKHRNAEPTEIPLDSSLDEPPHGDTLLLRVRSFGHLSNQALGGMLVSIHASEGGEMKTHYTKILIMSD